LDLLFGLAGDAGAAASAGGKRKVKQEKGKHE
jgi:hypothetical protein